MIRYALSCEAGHQFESWFRDMASYDHQLAGGFLICPACSSPRVGKAIMAPAIRTSPSPTPKGIAKALDTDAPGAKAPDTKAPDAKTADAKPADAPSNVALLDERHTEIRSMLKQLRDKVMTESQDVGRQFPEQARKMHEGDIPMRQIRGQATPDEARDLLEDGVLIMPLPTVPDELN